MNSNCKNCNPLCFEPVNDDCITFTGSSNSKIGITQNDSLKITLNKLIEFVDKLYDKVNECSLCNEESSQFSEVSTTSTSSSLLPISIESKAEDAGVSVSYAIGDLPQGHQLVYSTINVEGKKSGYDSILNSSSNMAGGVMLKPNNYPANLSVNVKTIAADGEHLFVMSLPISSLDNVLNSQILSNTSVPVTATNQLEVNSVLNTKIISLEEKVKSVSTITDASVPGNTTPETLLYLINKVKEIENSLN